MLPIPIMLPPKIVELSLPEKELDVELLLPGPNALPCAAPPAAVDVPKAPAPPLCGPKALCDVPKELCELPKELCEVPKELCDVPNALCDVFVPWAAP